VDIVKMPNQSKFTQLPRRIRTRIQTNKIDPVGTEFGGSEAL
jgi:hypothetical protein